ncbi:hypothetical protein [Anaeromicropila populeti]|uniref:ABC-2 type transport system permease protein n=1 Tax=Anaeromicropila populeti TaxID=37658 RepID=A0A1I6JRM6_9FIRM|nr:hypothetical protein [Anaeromicropila populeti]SFR81636.1 ABC-2 type transport system permease protein [Anaeromicropila populeti]
MINLIYGDLYKLRKSGAAKVCFLISCVCAFFLIYIAHKIFAGDLDASVGGSASGLGDIVIVSVLGPFMAGTFICHDFNSKTIHDAIACGNGRSNVIISKAIVYMLAIAALVIPYAAAIVTAYGMGIEIGMPFVISPFLNILSEIGGTQVEVIKICKIIVLSFIAMLVHGARLSFCIPLAFKMRKTGIIILIANVVCFLIDLVIRLLDEIPLIGSIVKWTPYAAGIFNVTMKTSAGELLKITGISIGFYAIMIAVTYVLFRKADIK